MNQIVAFSDDELFIKVLQMFIAHFHLTSHEHRIHGMTGTGIKKKRPDYTYYYSTLKPDAKLSFIALLGGGEARLSGFDGKRCIAEGEKKRLAEQDGDNTVNFLLKIACIIAGILAGLFVFADYLTIKEKEQKRAERQRSKQGKKK